MMRYSINTGLLTRYAPPSTCPESIEVYRFGWQYLRNPSAHHGKNNMLSPRRSESLVHPDVAVLDTTEQLCIHGILLRVQQM